jgi:glycosyltransferase involved in cell wall biosynthesis
MKVLMLGWEFPPHISGGLGTACQGIVSALGKIPDTKVIFVVPKVFGDEKSKNTTFVGANRYAESFSTILDRKIKVLDNTDLTYIETASFLHPYITAEELEDVLTKKHIKPETVKVNENGELVYSDKRGKERVIKISPDEFQAVSGGTEKTPEKFEFTGKYTSNLYQETGMFARVAERIAQDYDFDVIHAHDWLTYEAGIAIKEATGKPLVIHVHATEYDRSNGQNERVMNIERHGMQEADKIITVSNLTKEIVEEKYDIPSEKIQTVYNAVDFKPVRKKQKYHKNPGEKIVTFLGRITYQKGPEYFLRAAYKVIQRTENVRFVMAGNGDMYREMIRMTAHLKIAHRFHFTDFLDKDEVKQMFALSDVYVMPSVSEPFGIAPLEAVRSGVPVIISNQSGVAEVLENAVKVDYWDVNAMADAIYGLVKYPALSKFLKKNALAQIKKMKWDKPAADLSDIYKEVVYAALDEEKDVRMNVGHNVINQTKKSTNENNMPEL